MKLTLHRLHLPLAHCFTISRESIQTQGSLIVELEHDGVRGYGEVTENPFYGHDFDSISHSLQRAESLLEAYITSDPRDLWDRMLVQVGNDTFAAAALDMAAHDWHGKRLGKPTWQVWGLQWQDVPPSSYTIGIDDLDTMVAKLEEQPGWAIYKIKLGTPHDLDIVRRLRQVTDATFRVDANCAWTAAQTIEYSSVLADLGVQFIEQPLSPSASAEDKRAVFASSALPIIADEDCQVPTDVAACQPYFHGVNVKICKCGGLTPAWRMLREARSLGLQTMVGCMVESSIGISGAAQLLPLLDFADLDGAVLLKDQPASGIQVDQGRIRGHQSPGCGSQLQHERLPEFLAPPLPLDSTHG